MSHPRVLCALVRVRHVLSVLALTALALGCVDDGLLVDPARAPGSSVPLALSLMGPAGGAAEAFDQADALRVMVLGFDSLGLSSVLEDTTLAISPDGESVRASLPIEFDPARDSVQVVVVLQFEGAPLFTGTAAGRLVEGHTTPLSVTPEPVVDAVTVSAPIATIEAVGDTFRVTGAALFATGDTIVGTTLVWATDDESVATIDETGLITGVARGSAQVTASAGTVQSAPVGVTVASVSQGARSIAAGWAASCALAPDGYAYCVGSNNYADLGYGGTLGSSTPVEAQAPSLRQISMGSNMACGLDAAGAAWCWGHSYAGAGDGTLDTAWTAVPVAGGQSFVDIDVGQETVCALDAAGGAWCWGSNRDGELGTTSSDLCGGFACSLVPLRVDGGLGFTDISVGLAHACAVTADGTPYCWGWNAYSQLGDGTTGNRAAPTPVNTTQRFVSIAAGAVTSCGVTAAGAAWCWGSNFGGVLGNGAAAPAGEPLGPVQVTGGHVFRSVSVTSENSIYTHACGMTESGGVYCWGWDEAGQLGANTSMTCTFGTLTSDCSSTPVQASVPTVSSVAAGHRFTCAMTTTDQPWCWGNNDFAQLGDGTRTDRDTPAPVLAPAGDPVLGDVTLSHASADFDAPGDTVVVVVTILDTRGNVIPGPAWFVTADTTVVRYLGFSRDTVYWIGAGPGTTTLEMGLTTSRDAITATVAPPAPPTDSVPMTTGITHSCALDTAGQAWCWGGNAPGILGTGTSDLGAHAEPQAVAQGGLVFVSISAGGDHTCALTGEGIAYCWGANQSGQLGRATTETCTPHWNTGITVGCSSVPVKVNTWHRFTSLDGLGNHTCGTTALGTSLCWGANANGQLGTGATQGGPTLRLVQSGVEFTQYAGSTAHTCALAVDGSAYCWGLNGTGQLGIGSVGGTFTLPQAVNGGHTFIDIAADDESFAGPAHTCALTAAGQAYCWGANTAGQLGVNNAGVTEMTTPAAVDQGALVFTELSAGLAGTCARATDGTIHCWGNTSQGNSLTPIQMSATAMRDIEGAGADHACGIAAAGAAYCWGPNWVGQVGDGTTTFAATPVAVTGGITFR